MVVHYFYVVDPAVTPDKAQAPLFIDTDTMLASPVAIKRFESITWRATQEIHVVFVLLLL